ncbi:MAG: dihydrofolate reductase [Bacteroidia bacterium]|nr:dihydrofolate reductase [Bacteroidia bacterium]
MFGKKKEKSQIDQEQLKLIENAQRRIRQKKNLYRHFVIFLIGAVFLIIANTVLGIGETITLFGINWFVYAILIWLFLFAYHFFNVFVTHKFMGKDWEKEQLDILVSKQKDRIEQLKTSIAQPELEVSRTEIEELPKKKTNRTIIVAAGENNAIGKDNDLIWHLKDDLKRFKKITSGHHIIMGRKTFESFSKPLPNRTHIVITRQENYEVPEGVLIANSLGEAFRLAEHDKQPFVIGGGEIYKQAIPFVDKIELTRVHHSFPDADTFFPKIDESEWKIIANEFHENDEDHAYSFSFTTYVKHI